MTFGAKGPVLVVTGLQAEARLLRGPDVLAVSAPPATLAAKLDLACETLSPSAVVSFGLAGGLVPRLRPGAIVIAARVVAATEGWDCDAELCGRLAHELAAFAPKDGPLAACDEPVMTRAAKAELHARTNALAVDTESHIAAGFAAKRGLPFIVLRAVTDAAEADLPPLAMRAIDAEGRLDFAAIGSELRHRPTQLLQLPGTALATARALRALSRVRRRLGPRLGL